MPLRNNQYFGIGATLGKKPVKKTTPLPSEIPSNNFQLPTAPSIPVPTLNKTKTFEPLSLPTQQIAPPPPVISPQIPENVPPPNDLLNQQAQVPQTPIPDPVQKQEYVADPNLQNLATQDTNIQGAGDILSYLDPKLKTQVNQNISDLASGNLSENQQAISNQAMAAAAQKLRRVGGAANVGNIGQGAAIRGQQGIEQGILSELSNNSLRDQSLAEQNKLQGTQLATNLGQSNAQSQLAATQLASNEKLNALGIMSNENLTNDQNFLTEKLAQNSNYLAQQGIDHNEAQLFGYTDANGQHVKGSLEIQAEQFKAVSDSQIGQSFSSYIQANLNSDFSDPAVKNMTQNLWESLGNAGEVPKWWADQRIAAIKDPELTNPIIGTMSLIDTAFKNGAFGDMSPQEFGDFKEKFSKQMLGMDDPGSSSIDSELAQENKIVSDFDNAVTTLPSKYKHNNLTPELWKELDFDTPEKYKEWFDKNGENFLNIADMTTTRADEDDPNNVKYAKVPMTEANYNAGKLLLGGGKKPTEENFQKIREVFTSTTGTTEEEMVDNIKYVFRAFGDIPVTYFDEKYDSPQGLSFKVNNSKVFDSPEAKKYFKANNISEKEFEGMKTFFQQFKSPGDSNYFLRAFGYEVDWKEKGFKLKPYHP